MHLIAPAKLTAFYFKVSLYLGRILQTSARKTESELKQIFFRFIIDSLSLMEIHENILLTPQVQTSRRISALA